MMKQGSVSSTVGDRHEVVDSAMSNDELFERYRLHGGPDIRPHLRKMNADELLERYRRGERSFPRINFRATRADFSGQTLCDIDLSGSDLWEVNFQDADLRRANLSRCQSGHATRFVSANLRGARFRRSYFDRSTFDGADLSEADLMQLKLWRTSANNATIVNSNLVAVNFSAVYLQNVDFGESDLSYAAIRRSDLTDARIEQARLYGIDLVSTVGLAGRDFSGMDLERANLSQVDLSNANLSGVRLNYSECSHTQFVNANLEQANFTRARLHNALMHGANLKRANFTAADLKDAEFSNAVLDQAKFDLADLSDLDLEPLCRAQLRNDSPCRVGWQAIVRSLHARDLLQPFLVKCGVPEVFAIYMIECGRAVGEDSFKSLMQSVFIAYGTGDEEFARRLKEALESHHVRCWWFPEDSVPGETLHRELWMNLHRSDRVVLICSERSLRRTGVLRELQFAFDREDREGGTQIVIPVALDETVFEEWAPLDKSDLAIRLRDKVCADFRGTTENPIAFENAVGRLVHALRKKDKLRS